MYSSGIHAHSLRHVFSLRSPITNATTWRVRRHKAIHSQRLFTFFRTNDHSSSSSSRSSGSTGSNVSFTDGLVAAFFEPSSQSRAAHPKDTLNSAHTCTLIVICNNLFLLFFGVARSQFQNSPFTTIFAPILLMALSIMTIFDDVSAVTKTAFVDDCFLYHATKFITSLSLLPLPKNSASSEKQYIRKWSGDQPQFWIC